MGIEKLGKRFLVSYIFRIIKNEEFNLTLCTVCTVMYKCYVISLYKASQVVVNCLFVTLVLA